MSGVAVIRSSRFQPTKFVDRIAKISALKLDAEAL